MNPEDKQLLLDAAPVAGEGVPEDWRELVQQVASVGYHDMPGGSPPCVCSRCERTRKARNLLASKES